MSEIGGDEGGGWEDWGQQTAPPPPSEISESSIISHRKKNTLLGKASAFSSSRFARHIRAVDAFPKARNFAEESSSVGGSSTVVLVVLILYLVITETIAFQTITVSNELVVDTSFGGEMTVTMNITFPRVKCSDLSIDVLDASGEQRLDVKDTMFRVPYDESCPSFDGPVFIEREQEKEEFLEINRPKVETGSTTSSPPPLSGQKVLKSLNEDKKQLKEEPKEKDEAEKMEDTHNETEKEEKDAEKGENETTATPEEPSEFGTSKDKETESETEVEKEEEKEIGGEEVHEAEENEPPGCTIFGSLELQRLPGNFHFAPGKSYSFGRNGQSRHIHNFHFEEASRFNSSHIIHELSFGSGGPLSGVKKVVDKDWSLFKYFLNVVPTVTYPLGTWELAREYEDLFLLMSESIAVPTNDGEDMTDDAQELMRRVAEREHMTARRIHGVVRSNQYSATEYTNNFDLNKRQILPGVYFVFDLFPWRIEYHESKMPFWHFFTRLSAIIGGVYVLAGWITQYILRWTRKVVTCDPLISQS
eukprot:TRINITY_DN1102_c0_g1_i1.p1 TRINITY_DN1102_c0_g1~~TRINITY_DN1102_c0_g1_i1.p1  ORF type:complete len:532 (-),score=148.04 TRINITY_DN1102_c0_g1_i1:767-2362(-)